MRLPLLFRMTRGGGLVLSLGSVLVAASVVYLFYRFTRPPVAARPAGHWGAVEKGRAYLGEGRPDLALDAVSLVRDEAPGAGEAMTVAGLALLQLRNFQGARLALERAIKLRPDQADATKTLASLHLMLGNGVRGSELLRAAAQLDPEDVKVWLSLGKVSHDLGEPAEAAAAFKEVLKRDPGNREAVVGRVTDLLNGNRPDEATSLLTEALRRRPDDPALLGLAARHARDMGRADEAVELASRALITDPVNVHALLVRARVRLASGHPEQALVDAERGAATHPNDLGALQLLAQVESRLGMTERASATMERHRRANARTVLIGRLTEQIARNPDDPEPRCRLGQAAVEGGAYVLAGRCFQAALDLNPNYQPARDALIALQAAQPDAASAAARPDAQGTSPGTPDQAVQTSR